MAGNPSFAYSPEGLEHGIAQAGGAYEPQRQYAWMLHVEGINGSGVLELSSRTAAPPSEASEEIGIPILNSTVYVAGKQTWEAGSFVFHDYVDANTAKVLNDWRRLVYDPITGKQGYARVYKKLAELVMFGPMNETRRSWLLHGIWPITVNFGTLDYSTSDIVQIECSFRYDRAVAAQGF